MKLNFISLEHNLEKAMYYRNNPDMQFYSFKGVQLLPNNIYPYIQTTFNNEGIELEDWEVFVKSICGETLADITDNFDVVDNFQDSDTGLPQITWKLTDLPDCGNRLVYLEVNQLAGDTFYSTPFFISSEESERTSRIDYRNDDSEFMQSVQVNLNYIQKTPVKEYAQYYEITTERTRTNTIKSQYSELWRTGIIDIEALVLLQSVFDFKETYLNLMRTSIFEPFEIPLLEANENFIEQDIKLTFDNSDFYNPNFVPIIPQPIPPLPPLLRITDMRRNGNIYGSFFIDFVKENFNPQYVTVLYKTLVDEEIRNTGTSVSPRIVNLPYASNPNFTIYQVRLYQAGAGVYSNKAFINQANGFYFLLTEKISSTQYKLRARYVSDEANDPVMTWTNNGVSQNFPNNGISETTINAIQGQTLVSSISQDGLVTTITIIL